jgi:hypothetical protein
VSGDGVPAVLPDSISWWFGASPDFFPPNPASDAAVFEDVQFTRNDIGRRFLATAQNDPDVDRLVAL